MSPDGAMDDIVNIHYAKTHLSRLLLQVEAGHSVVIARAGKPVGKLVPMPEQGKRKFGALRGLVKTGPELLAPLSDDELDAWGQ
jgi:prevent-host-death family protein